MESLPPSVLAYAIEQGWPFPNYINPITREYAFVVVNLTLLGVTMLVVSLRIYTRIFISKYLGKDDILMLMAMVSSRENVSPSR